MSQGEKKTVQGENVVPLLLKESWELTCLCLHSLKWKK